MKFEVINDKNKVVMHTLSPSCIPSKDILTSMLNAGYKFKLDGKMLSKKAINELAKGERLW